MALRHIALETRDLQRTRPRRFAPLPKRLRAAGVKVVGERGRSSIYVTDPNGLILEFTRDHPDVEQIARDRRADAHAALKRWLAGDHTSNNTYRSGETA